MQPPSRTHPAPQSYGAEVNYAIAAPLLADAVASLRAAAEGAGGPLAKGKGKKSKSGPAAARCAAALANPHSVTARDRFMRMCY
jgi:hypothetical protein